MKKIWVLVIALLMNSQIVFAENNLFGDGSGVFVDLEDEKSIKKNNLLNDDWRISATLKDLQYEIKHRANVRAKSSIGLTPLMYAAKYSRNPEMFAALIKAGADVNATDEEGLTALMLATSNNPAVVQTLIEAGADVNAEDEALGTVLMHAALDNNPAVVQTLIDAGADVNAKDEDGRTALMLAVKYNFSAVVQVLIEAGAKK